VEYKFPKTGSDCHVEYLLAVRNYLIHIISLIINSCYGNTAVKIIHCEYAMTTSVSKNL